MLALLLSSASVVVVFFFAFFVFVIAGHGLFRPRRALTLALRSGELWHLVSIMLSGFVYRTLASSHRPWCAMEVLIIALT